MSKAILVTGATGKQGGSVVDALLELPNASDYTILAVTRNTEGAAAKKLASRGVKLVKGDLDNVTDLFATAKEVAKAPIWGVYSVQISMGKGVTMESEIKQGTDLIDESVKNDVKVFVYSSVDRGGDEKSWDEQTPIGHFQTKHKIEHYLRENAGQMGWTILRPVAFMDNLAPGMPTKVFMTAMRDSLNGKSTQWVATADIGVFVAKAFDKPEEFNHQAIGLAGDELDFPGICKAFENTTGSPIGTTFWFLGGFLKYMVTELGTMLNWFGSDGYGADIAKCKKIYPNMLDMETWIKEKSAFTTK